MFAHQLCSFHPQQHFEHIKRVRIQLGCNKVVMDLQQTKMVRSPPNKPKIRSYKNNISLGKKKKKIWAPKNLV